MPDQFRHDQHENIQLKSRRAVKQMKNSNYRIQCRDLELDLTGRAKIMGILNTTPDSFYDGGTFPAGSRKAGIDLAVEKALEMIEEGADIIDIGGESTRPGAQKVDTEEELRRTLPVIDELRRQSDILISIDTYKAAVAEQALLAGAQIINDISGFSFDPHIAEVCRRYSAAAVLMHTTGRPDSMKWSHQETGAAGTDIMTRVKNGLLHSLKKAEIHGIHNVILDPGFGFGKNVPENYELLRRLRELQTFRRPMLAGLSRKSFLGKALQKHPDKPVPPPEDRLTATIAANTIAVTNGANILRVHDVKEAAETLAVAASARAQEADPPVPF